MLRLAVSLRLSITTAIGLALARCQHRSLTFVVRRNAMRTINFIVALALLTVCGCAERSVTSPSQPVTAKASAPAPPPATDATAAMVGTWHCREHGFLWDLADDGHWKWWDLSEQSGRPSDPPMLAGTWFVRNEILFLRIQETKEPAERIGPGLAFTFDVKSVTADAMILHQMREQEDMKFRRIAEPSAAPNGGPAAPVNSSRLTEGRHR